MNVKRYRAATMRDALERIKRELGEDALVLGSEKVRSAGFFGLGAKDLVEVRVSGDFSKVTSAGLAGVNKSTPQTSKYINLSLNNPAPPKRGLSPASPLSSSPSFSPPRSETSGSAFSALAARAYSAEAASVATNPVTTRSATAIVLERARTREADTRDSIKPAPPQQTPALNQQTKGTPSKPQSTTAGSTPKRDPVLIELDRLRAEMREMKFAIGTFAGNHRDGNAPSNASEADARIYDSPFYETYLHLGILGLDPELAKAATRAAIEAGSESKDILELARIGLMNSLPSVVTFGEDPLARAKDAASPHPVVALVGPTGVGKTTTIAKLAARTALREGRRVELITLDTYRIAAVEQLKTYADIIGAGFHVPRSILELDVLVRRFSAEATVIIDTIGRSARDLADQMELADYLRGNEQIVKCLVLQATMHPGDAHVALGKFALFGINSLVITKLDETCRTGAVVTIAASAGLPLAYLCNGQGVPDDIERATAESLTACTLGHSAFAMAA